MWTLAYHPFLGLGFIDFPWFINHPGILMVPPWRAGNPMGYHNQTKMQYKSQQIHQPWGLNNPMVKQKPCVSHPSSLCVADFFRTASKPRVTRSGVRSERSAETEGFEGSRVEKLEIAGESRVISFQWWVQRWNSWRLKWRYMVVILEDGRERV